MLITNKVKTKWNSKTKRYYESLGYKYSFVGESFFVKTEDLKPSSSEVVEVECDYCHKKYFKRYVLYLKNRNDSPIKKDVCTKCKHLKAMDSNLLVYGKRSVLSLDYIKEKVEKTNIDKYGFANVFKNEDIKNKIVKTNFKKYGFKSFTQTKEYGIKTRKTSLERYGFESAMKSEKVKDKFRGANSPVWKGGKKDARWERLGKEYKEWRQSVFIKDHFICQKCLKHSSKLEAHHIANWKDNEKLRYDKNNGITFCVKCHINFHRIYGKKNNNDVQLKEYLQQR